MSSFSCAVKLVFLFMLHILDYPIPITIMHQTTSHFEPLSNSTAITIKPQNKPHFEPLSNSTAITIMSQNKSDFEPLSNSTTTDKLETKLSSAKFGFLADLGVGSQCLRQPVLMDTGSSLLWINCHPCVLDAPEPLFDPKGSTSFERVNCMNTDMCEKTGAVKMEPCAKGRCPYYIAYGSGVSKGYLARDAFKLGASGKELENIVFGCAKHAWQTGASTGVLGLATNRLSLLSQINATKFSYCFGNISDNSYSHSFFAIGDYLGVFRHKTRLLIDGQYFINLESIRIGKKLLEVDPRIFERIPTEYIGGMVVDTGSTYSFIPLVALKKFEKEVINLLEDSSIVLIRNYSVEYKGYRRLCYDGVLTRDLRGFPRVYLTFEGEATMELTAENVFYQLYDSCFCLAILPSEVRMLSFSLLGNVMQQFFYVGIDLEAKEFKFSNVDCAELRDPS